MTNEHSIEFKYLFCSFSRVCLFAENQDGDFIDRVELESLPITSELIEEGKILISEFCCLPENVDPHDKEHWSYKDREKFKKDRKKFYSKLVLELGPGFKIEYKSENIY